MDVLFKFPFFFLFPSAVSHAAIVKLGNMEESGEESRKKFTVGEEEDGQTELHTSHPVKKAHARHHVKRKSGGRVHVSKLMQMTRASSHNQEDSESGNLETENDGKRSIIVRRTSSQRSLPRLAAMEKLSVTNANEEPQDTYEAHTHVEAKQNHPPQLVKHEPSVASAKVTPFTAHADHMIATNKVLANTTISNSNSQRQPMKSQFIQPSPDASPSSPPSNELIKKHVSGSHPDITKLASTHESVAFNSEPATPTLTHQQSDQRINPPDMVKSSIQMAASTTPTAMTRTQQKLLLQRQHFLADDENNLAHPRNQLRLTKEMEHVNREYLYVRRYQDPMTESLIRCMEKKQRNASAISMPNSPERRPHSNLQRSLTSRSMQDTQSTLDHSKRWSSTASNLLDRVLGSN
jgi:TORC1 subunit TCO89